MKSPKLDNFAQNLVSNELSISTIDLQIVRNPRLMRREQNRSSLIILQFFFIPNRSSLSSSYSSSSRLRRRRRSRVLWFDRLWMTQMASWARSIDVASCSSGGTTSRRRTTAWLTQFSNLTPSVLPTRLQSCLLKIFWPILLRSWSYFRRQKSSTQRW